MSRVFNQALSRNDLISDEDTSVIFYDLTFLNERMASLQNLFPKTTLHALAVKANPLTGILKRIREFGLGLDIRER